MCKRQNVYFVNRIIGVCCYVFTNNKRHKRSNRKEEYINKVQSNNRLITVDFTFPGTPYGPNVALNKEAWQPSTMHGGVASRAVDGNDNPDFGAGSCIHTDHHYYPAWGVDLGNVMIIHAVEIMRRDLITHGREWELSNSLIRYNTERNTAVSASTLLPSLGHVLLTVPQFKFDGNFVLM